eukprot:2814857-Rhodomonas_salina.2
MRCALSAAGQRETRVATRTVCLRSLARALSSVALLLASGWLCADGLWRQLAVALSSLSLSLSLVSRVAALACAAVLTMHWLSPSPRLALQHEATVHSSALSSPRLLLLSLSSLSLPLALSLCRSISYRPLCALFPSVVLVTLSISLRVRFVQAVHCAILFLPLDPPLALFLHAFIDVRRTRMLRDHRGRDRGRCETTNLSPTMRWRARERQGWEAGRAQGRQRKGGGQRVCINRGRERIRRDGDRETEPHSG